MKTKYDYLLAMYIGCSPTRVCTIDSVCNTMHRIAEIMFLRGEM